LHGSIKLISSGELWSTNIALHAPYLQTDDLHAGTEFLGGAELELFIDESEFVLNPLHIYLPGGDLDAEYTTKNTDGRLTSG
jgi:hypothetical protein